MKLISDIINELIDSSKPIDSALLKTKVLAVRIDNNNLQQWVNGELNGFSESAIIPGYRKSTGILKGNYVNGRAQYTKVAIPTLQLSKEHQDSITKIELRESISSIEAFKDKKDLRISVNSGAKYIIENSIRSNNPYFQLLTVYLDIPASLFTDVLSCVRSKLLDFMLEIEKKFGYETEIADLKGNSEVITQIFNTTINTNGDGNVITSGNNNESNVNALN